MRSRLLAVAGSGLLLIALAACSQAADGNTTMPGVGGGAGSAVESSPTASPTPAAQIDSVTGGSTAITLASGFTDALSGLDVKPAATGNATLDGGVLAFPVTGGSLTAYPAAAGVDPAITAELDHDGSGLSLTTGSRRVVLDDLVVELGAHPRVTGDVHVGGSLVAQGASLFVLDVADAAASTANGQTVIDGVGVSLSEGAAGALNSAFRTDAVTAGLPVGTAQLTVSGR